MIANNMFTNKMTTLQLTGRAGQLAPQSQQPHLLTLPEQSVQLHCQVLAAFQALQALAHQAGMTLSAVSGYRSFDQQLQIWNNKFNGLRPILDHASQPIDPAILSDEDKVFAILRWSMLPGASRHHWGTEIDVCDYSALPQGYQLQLIPQEYDDGGYLAELNHWLEENLPGTGFYRPYRQDLGGVAREPWHLSYQPIATQAQQEHTLALLSETITAADIAGKQAILANLEQIYRQYVTNVCD